MTRNKIDKVLPRAGAGAAEDPESAVLTVYQVVAAEVVKGNTSTGSVARPVQLDAGGRGGRPPRDLAYVTKEEAAAAAAALREPPWRALCRFLWLSGARVSEALAVTPADVDTRGNVVHLTTLKRRGRKKGQRRAVPLPASFVAELLYVATYSRRLLNEPIWPVRREQAWRRMHKALTLAGVESSRAHPHVFRHGHAIHALRSGASLDLVAANLGHASTVTTALYLRATGADVKKAYDGIDW